MKIKDMVRGWPQCTALSDIREGLSPGPYSLGLSKLGGGTCGEGGYWQDQNVVTPFAGPEVESAGSPAWVDIIILPLGFTWVLPGTQSLSSHLDMTMEVNNSVPASRSLPSLLAEGRFHRGPVTLQNPLITSQTSLSSHAAQHWTLPLAPHQTLLAMAISRLMFLRFACWRAIGRGPCQSTHLGDLTQHHGFKIIYVWVTPTFTSATKFSPDPQTLLSTGLLSISVLMPC